MPLTNHFTLTQYLIAQRRQYPTATGDFNALILDVALACKSIARAVAFGELGGLLGEQADNNGAASAVNVQGETQKKLDVLSNDALIDACGTPCWPGWVSEEHAERDRCRAGVHGSGGAYLVVFDPLDGSSNVETNVAIGSIFSVLPHLFRGTPASAAAFMQPGTAPWSAAGYAIYGPSTVLVLSLGQGVHMFTLDPDAPGDAARWVLTRADVEVPVSTTEFAINASNQPLLGDRPCKRYVDECLAGKTGPRGKDFNMRWIASMVAEAHRILMRGGVFMYPRDTKDPSKPGRLRLLYEANPVGFIMEQAGGRASTGRQPMLGITPTGLHQRIGLVFGSRNEVERIERYHNEPQTRDTGHRRCSMQRSLFRD